MGLYGHIKNWLSKPLAPNTDPVTLCLYVGLLFIFAWMWSSVIQGIGRIGKAVTA